MTEKYYRRLIVASIIPESESAKSFRLVPLDGGPLEPHRPGQHLPIRLGIPGHSRPVLRCYTISNFGESFYRLTLKKELPPENKPEIGPGLSSSFFHETVRTGTVIEASRLQVTSGSIYRRIIQLPCWLVESESRR